jgi:hypothetical protein
VRAPSCLTPLLAFYSQLNNGGSTWDKFDPILVIAFVFCFVCIEKIHAREQMVDMKDTLGGQSYFFPGTSRRFNEGPARHSSEDRNVQVVPQLLGSEGSNGENSPKPSAKFCLDERVGDFSTT